MSRSIAEEDNRVDGAPSVPCLKPTTAGAEAAACLLDADVAVDALTRHPRLCGQSHRTGLPTKRPQGFHVATGGPFLVAISALTEKGRCEV